jgi:1-acyl-sn-glycerol-3-phosphate acyltransferase
MFWWVVKCIVGPIIHIVWRPKNSGMENVPKSGPVILASNHLSFADHFFGPWPLRRRIVFLGKRDYFTGKGVKGFLSKMFFSGVGVIPLDRTGGKASEEALVTGLRVLGEGKQLGIYPEGTRVPDNRLFKGKTGVARLALQAKVPVVPMAMINTFELMPAGQKPKVFGLPGRPGVRFGKPIWRPATRERERLARDIHDSVLQVLALVKRRGAGLDGEAGELARLAGEQEAALRTLVTGRDARNRSTSTPRST